MLSGGRRVIVLVCDGLRPDYVTPGLMPNLSRIAGEGARFDRSHAVAPTVTRCNSASLATGALPANHGLPGNSFYAPRVFSERAVNSGNHLDLEALRAFRDGHILTRPTLGELVSGAGGKTVVLGTGTPGASLLLHPQAADRGDLSLNPASWTDEMKALIESRMGPAPQRVLPNTALNAYVTRIITDVVLPQDPPDLLYFWHSDPDSTSHARGLGHPDTLRSIQDADTNVGKILDTVRALGQDQDTDIFVVSDHGYSDIAGRVDVAAELMAAGIRVPEDIFVTAGFLYNTGGDPTVMERAWSVLSRVTGVGASFVGPRGSAVPGTLPAATIGVGGELGPDLMISGAWNEDPNQYGVRGYAWVQGGGGPGPAYVANHGSLSPLEIRNTLIAWGSGFKRGLVSEVPVGIIDVAPTAAQRLGILESWSGDGRVLSELLADGPDIRDLKPGGERETATSGAGRSTSLQLSRLGDHAYVDWASLSA